jgi:hypothetical protein
MSPQEVAHAENVAFAEKSAKAMLGVGLDQALQMLDRGDLDGTTAEAELRSLRFLLGR